MVIKVLVSGISASKEVKKRQQRAMLILDSAQVEYEPIDITEPGRDEEKANLLEAWKQRKGEGSTVPLPPQFFNDEDYLGDFEDFNLAVDVNEILKFLKLKEPEEVQTNGNGHLQENLEVTRVNETPSEEYDAPTSKDDDDEHEHEKEEQQEEGEAESGEHADETEAVAETASESAAKRKEADEEGEGEVDSGEVKKFKPVASDADVEEIEEEEEEGEEKKETEVTSPLPEESKGAEESEEEEEDDE